MDSNNTSLEVLPHLPKHEFLHDQSNVIIMNFNLISSQRAQKKKQKKKKTKKKKNSTIRNHVTAKFPCYPRSHHSWLTINHERLTWHVDHSFQRIYLEHFDNLSSVCSEYGSLNQPTSWLILVDERITLISLINYWPKPLRQTSSWQTRFLIKDFHTTSFDEVWRGSNLAETILKDGEKNLISFITK